MAQIEQRDYGLLLPRALLDLANAQAARGDAAAAQASFGRALEIYETRLNLQCPYYDKDPAKSVAVLRCCHKRREACACHDSTCLQADTVHRAIMLGGPPSVHGRAW